LPSDQPARAPATAVVIGGTGFLGRHLCAGLAADGYRVVAVARRAGTTALPYPVRILDAARATPAEIGALLCPERPAVVVNAAGSLWAASDEDMTADNLTLVDNLLTALTALPWRPRLIHLGSVYEYGRQPAGIAIREDAPERPVAHYGRTKLAGSRRVQAAVRLGLDAVVLRLSAAIGPGAPSHSLFGSIADRLAAGRHADRPVPLVLPPIDGERDFIDVHDIADAVVAAAATAAVTGILNVGHGTLVAVRDAVHRLIDISGVPVTITTQPSSRPRRDAGIGSPVIDITAARRRLHWAPRRTLTDALAALWHDRQRWPAAAPAL
jgi:nucleoside-diphosphate-sugar epimerase